MELIFATIAGLLPIINPFSTAPLFLSLTRSHTPEQKIQQATKGVIYMFAILTISLIGGTFIMKFFGLSLPGMRIAGGLLVAGVGFGMLKPQDDPEQTPEEKKEAKSKDDISFTPLAMPSLSGPGAISVVIGMSSLVEDWYQYLYITGGILIVAGMVWFTLRSAAGLVRFLGVNGLHALTKIMGFIILCVGVQFIVNGILGIVTGDVVYEFLNGIHKN
jgi:multiple antibiotic resistance protein